MGKDLPQNAGMPTNEEKSAFSRRLELALRRSPEPVQGATELALRFNLRYRGNAVSAQTAHKWLTGRAIPTNDKLATLAAWLNVSEHWLHYGPPPAQPSPPAVLKARQQQTDYPATAAGAASPQALALALRIQSLPAHQR